MTALIIPIRLFLFIFWCWHSLFQSWRIFSFQGCISSFPETSQIKITEYHRRNGKDWVWIMSRYYELPFRFHETDAFQSIFLFKDICSIEQARLAQTFLMAMRWKSLIFMSWPTTISDKSKICTFLCIHSWQFWYKSSFRKHWVTENIICSVLQN